MFIVYCPSHPESTCPTEDWDEAVRVAIELDNEFNTETFIYKTKLAGKTQHKTTVVLNKAPRKKPKDKIPTEKEIIDTKTGANVKVTVSDTGNNFNVPLNARCEFDNKLAVTGTTDTEGSLIYLCAGCAGKNNEMREM